MRQENKKKKGGMDNDNAQTIRGEAMALLFGIGADSCDSTFPGQWEKRTKNGGNEENGERMDFLDCPREKGHS